MRQIVDMGIRSDSAGDGHYGAPRGSRTHRGIDFECQAYSPVLSPVDGVVTKLGYPYGDDLVWRYIQITTSDELDHRFFYVEPSLVLGDTVSIGDVIGDAQKISERYPNQGMKPHVHYEVKTAEGQYLDPRQPTS